ncbi:uncharacterized protein THITE_2115773 [Thermothielavioides terrestris NRRL 8126]|uniref:Uncharacterized protein n=1 Tax=Thermothielavioides terrestris (strain ATCC 38088 / NRRL 8126) TaxID=578455 RepID=G2QYE1_THETT|nr:uncharacterized protein THITE_2115773 [Thermothielavioides terrestris NRRL 8126]AEO67037.1 hypothetical protein THITE_2115773 [Thermothielavioides terrestris NRRL 8126]
MALLTFLKRVMRLGQLPLILLFTMPLSLLAGFTTVLGFWFLLARLCYAYFDAAVASVWYFLVGKSHSDAPDYGGATSPGSSPSRSPGPFPPLPAYWRAGHETPSRRRSTSQIEQYLARHDVDLNAWRHPDYDREDLQTRHDRDYEDVFIGSYWVGNLQDEQTLTDAHNRRMDSMDPMLKEYIRRQRARRERERREYAARSRSAAAGHQTPTRNGGATPNVNGSAHQSPRDGGTNGDSSPSPHRRRVNGSGGFSVPPAIPESDLEDSFDASNGLKTSP